MSRFGEGFLKGFTTLAQKEDTQSCNQNGVGCPQHKLSGVSLSAGPVQATSAVPLKTAAELARGGSAPGGGRAAGVAHTLKHPPSQRPCIEA